MVDLRGQYLKIKPEIDSAVERVLHQTKFINGPDVDTFARSLENFMGVKHVIPCANGTDALQAALMSLNLAPGDEIITPTFTFVATVEVIALLGLVPVLVDINPQTFNIIPQLIEAAITPKTKAIVPVHLFGQGAPMDKIIEIAKRHNLLVVEDAAQCLGAGFEMTKGKQMKLGTIGDIGCTSFFPSKNLGCFGDGGACFTNNDELASQLRQIVNHGAKTKYYHNRIGINSRLDTLQAAILNVKLTHLDEYNNRRKWAAAKYDNALVSVGPIELPARAERSEHVFHQYTVKVTDGNRQQLAAYLLRNGVPTMVYYPRPIHRQEAFEALTAGEGNFINADILSDQVLSLPMHTELDDRQIDYIADLIRKFYN
jgi:dTDP-4-amino-4,6-dideoxygalactose transaminase